MEGRFKRTEKTYVIYNYLKIIFYLHQTLLMEFMIVQRLQDLSLPVVVWYLMIVKPIFKMKKQISTSSSSPEKFKLYSKTNSCVSSIPLSDDR